MTSLSSKDDDYLLSNSGHAQRDLLPQVVTVSGLNELQNTLRERDNRIAFLEKELIETRLQLASSKTREDQLSLKLRVERACGDSNSEEGPRVLSPSESEVTVTSQRPAVSTVDSRPAENAGSPHHARAGSLTNSVGDSIRVMLGKPITSHHDPRPPVTVASRKRNMESDLLLVSGGTHWGAGADSFHNLIPGSCASGLDLLAGSYPSYGSSSSTVNRMLDGVGLFSESSENFLKKRRSGSADLAGSSHQRRNTAATSAGSKYQGNEGWGNPLNRAHRNMFANCLLSTRPSASFTAGPTRGSPPGQTDLADTTT